MKLAKNNCDNSLHSTSPAGAKKCTDPVMGGRSDDRCRKCLSIVFHLYSDPTYL